jgi:hypothetical protein
VTLVPPVLVSVSDRDCLLPTVKLPKPRLVGFDPNVPGVTPVPDNGMVRLGFEALDVTLTLPLALPADAGVNVTVKVALWPDVKVTGVVIPLKLNPVPLTATWEIVTLAPPVLVNVSDSDCLFPTVTLPNPRLVGFDPNVPGATPVPDRGLVSVGLDPFDVSVTLPVALPADAGVNVTVKVALCPAVSVTGVVIPLRVKPAPLIVAEEIVTLTPPVLVTVSDRDCLFPTVTLPKLRLVGFAPKAPGVTPVPDKGIVRVGLDAFEVSVTLPVTLPADAGLKVTVKVVLCPAVRVTGVVMPLRANPEPPIVAEEIVTLEPPVLVTVSESDCLFPNVTVPKARLVGFDPRPPGATPVPDRGIVREGFEAFEVIVTLLLAAPVDAGAKVTLKVALWPVVRVTGVVIPLRLKLVPLIATSEIVMLAPPVFVTVSDSDCLFPTVTLPKLRLTGLDPSTPGLMPVPDNGMLRLGLNAFEVTLTLPLALVADCGVKATLKFAL